MTISKRKYYSLLGIVFLLLVIAIPAMMYRHYQEKEGDRVFVWVKPFQTPLGWGYDIYAGKKLYIHQDFIPAVAGKHGFKTREDALAVGRKVIEKIGASGIPTITEKELKELGVIDDTLAGK